MRSNFLLLCFLTAVAAKQIFESQEVTDRVEERMEFEDHRDQCTTIGVGRKAMIDGST